MHGHMPDVVCVICSRITHTFEKIQLTKFHDYEKAQYRENNPLKSQPTVNHNFSKQHLVMNGRNHFGLSGKLFTIFKKREAIMEEENLANMIATFVVD